MKAIHEIEEDEDSEAAEETDFKDDHDFGPYNPNLYDFDGSEDSDYQWEMQEK